MAESPGTAQLPGEPQGNLMDGYKYLKERLKMCLGLFAGVSKRQGVKYRRFCLSHYCECDWGWNKLSWEVVEGPSPDKFRISLWLGLGSLDVLDGSAGAGAGQGDFRGSCQPQPVPENWKYHTSPVWHLLIAFCRVWSQRVFKVNSLAEIILESTKTEVQIIWGKLEEFLVKGCVCILKQPFVLIQVYGQFKV